MERQTDGWHRRVAPLFWPAAFCGRRLRWQQPPATTAATRAASARTQRRGGRPMRGGRVPYRLFPPPAAALALGRYSQMGTPPHAAPREHPTRNSKFYGPKCQVKWHKKPGCAAQYPRSKTSTALEKGPHAYAEYQLAWDFRASLGLRMPGTTWDCMDFGSLTGIHVA